MSGASPPLRSLWFGEGLTSATTEDSGRNSDATIRAPRGRLQEPLVHDEKLVASGGGDCAETTMRDKLVCARPSARALAAGVGYPVSVVQAHPHPKKPRRPGPPVADPTVQLRDAFRPAYATHSTFPTTRNSLIGPDNTRLG